MLKRFKKHLKRIIKKIPYVGLLIHRFYRWVFPKVRDISYWISRNTEDKVNYNVIQIGSNDGVTGDPISELLMKNEKWEAVFVEPVPYIYQKLKRNYSDETRFKCENVAINDGSSQTFYWVDPKVINEVQELPVWYDQLGSFDKNNIVKHLDGILTPYILETEVQGLSLIELIKESNFDQVDLLHIDTEGYDWKILSQLDLTMYCPHIVLFEHTHLTKQEKEASISFMQNDFYMFHFGGDFLCIKKSQFKNDHLKSKYLRRILINPN